MATTYPTVNTLAAVSIASTIKDGTSLRGEISEALTTLTVTQTREMFLTIPASGSVTITVADEFGVGVAAKLGIVSVANGSVSTSMTVEVNDCGTANTMQYYMSYGDASLTHLEITETGGASALKVLVVLAT